MARNGETIAPAVPAIEADMVLDEEKLKPTPSHIEGLDALTAEDVVMKSPFEDMSLWRTIVVFRKATMIALFAAFSAAAE